MGFRDISRDMLGYDHFGANPIPERKNKTMKVNTYLNFGGNCAEALRFYEEHLGGKITMMMTYDQMPEPKNFPPGMEKSVLHARIELGDAALMASDGPPERVEPMRSAYICLNVDSIDEAERIHGLLSDGGEVFMPMGETFYAHRFSMLRDKFGIAWMVIHQRPMPQNA
jgi:PhnB protein